MAFVAFAFTDRALDFLSELPPKLRRQVIKKARSLHGNPFPSTAKRLHGIETPEGEPVYRERSGDYRILYVVRTNPAEVLIIDIDHRKDVYRMPKTRTEPADEMRMTESAFDEIMRGALGVNAPVEDANNDDQLNAKRLSAYPKKRDKI